ncbi:hypothetical protein TTHERM_00227140 (macronuclear) [Tetrahymena thermophila SB210]|uniref:RNA polymerase sigma-70 domain-containing protein n=1 Tax=Tetrahymena thermophila (strain SB210) TaxID=312017 RepID=Q23BW8_TETTS|nr:hypothetical protein TTHERM_00227140 [Tetrahymena thermophila SB210]EAR94000.1 hypothetical protein TTHERM_00227140 [Tetrahymena thermophila SB210]|eukprot:XP_001014245.1 hypothetical protein TTHERM_00227140 [Tetrahymena thermophila SB210]
MSCGICQLPSFEADCQQLDCSTQTYFESSTQESEVEVKEILKENLPVLISFHTQQFQQTALNGIKKNLSSHEFVSSRQDEKSSNKQLNNSFNLIKQQPLNKMGDVKYLIQMLKRFHQLKQMLISNQQKFLAMESHLSDLKSKLQQSISYFDKYSSFWMKKIIDNQMNKQILNYSLEYQKEIQIQKERILEELHQIKFQIKFCLQSFKDTPIFADTYQKILIKLEENQYSNKQISQSEFDFILTEKINSKNVLNAQDENQSDIETQDTYTCLDSEINQVEFLNEQANQESFRLKVAFAGVNQQNLNQYIYKQNIKQKEQNSLYGESTGIVAISTALFFASQKIPNIDLISLGCIGLIQSIVNFSNPHRTLTSCLREQNILMSQITICGGLGLTGAAIGQALIPVPVFGALVGGLVMEFFGIYISSKIRDWSISTQLQKQSNFFAENNVEVSESNLDQYCDIMDIKKESLKDKIVLPNQNSLNKLLSSEKQMETEKPFGDIEKLQIYLLYCLQNIGLKLYACNKEMLGENTFNQLSELHNQLESFTEYFDFDYLSIGKNLHEIYNQLKEKIQVEDIKKIVEEIDPINIDGNNVINQQQESIKKCCKLEKLAQLLKEKNIDEGIIIESLPDSIQKLKSNQKLDLWCTYICIQLLSPQYVFLDILMMKVNFQLESKNLFFFDTIDQYFPIIKEMFEEI